MHFGTPNMGPLTLLTCKHTDARCRYLACVVFFRISYRLSIRLHGCAFSKLL